MFKKTLIAGLLTLAGFATVSAADLAKVNGEAIPMSASDNVVKAAVANGAKDTPQLRTQIKNDLIIREVLWQEAEDQKLDKSDDVEKALEAAKQSFAINALHAKYVKDNPVSESDVKAAYSKYAAANTGKQYQLQHIMVKTEAEAKAIIAQLQKGAKFETLAAQKSLDNGTKANGGNLGWQNPNALIQPLPAAVNAMKAGQFSTSPVKSQAGYHVLKVLNTRIAKAEPYDKVKGNIRANLENQKWNGYVSSLIKKAKIEQ